MAMRLLLKIDLKCLNPNLRAKDLIHIIGRGILEVKSTGLKSNYTTDMAKSNALPNKAQGLVWI